MKPQKQNPQLICVLLYLFSLQSFCCGSGMEQWWQRWVSLVGLWTGVSGEEWISWVLHRHLWRTHIVASLGEKTEHSGNTGGISYCDVISHKTFSLGQMKERGPGGVGRVKGNRRKTWMKDGASWIAVYRVRINRPQIKQLWQLLLLLLKLHYSSGSFPGVWGLWWGGRTGKYIMNIAFW